MRARLAIKQSGVKVNLREVVLRNKPPSMLSISPKGTVPVLQLPNGDIIDESWDIVHWATLAQEGHPLRGDSARILEANHLVSRNDNEFKQHLDHYKYADRFPEFSAEHYRTQAEAFLSLLNQRLAEHSFLLDDEPSIADIGIFPFIRQFAHVDIDWFHQTPYQHLQCWFDSYLSSELFASIMTKYPAWEEGQDALLF